MFTTQIEFLGNDYLLIGTLEDGAIATRQQFENNETSFAHIYPNGDIKRFGMIIGTRKDITVLNAQIDV